MKSFILGLVMILAVMLLPRAPESAAQDEEHPLIGSRWQLISFGTTGEETPVIEGSSVTLNLDAENQAGGGAGCNSYAAAYTLEADMISFGMVSSTKVACADADVMEQEQTYLAALASTGRYEIADDALTIWYDDGEQQLNYVLTAKGRLMRYEWQAVSYGEPGEETPVIPDSTVTLRFEQDEFVNGSAGCNSYSTGFEIVAGELILNPIGKTLMLCRDAAIMEQEDTYLAALQSAGKYELSEDGTELTVWYDDGQRQINFVASVRSRLMKTEWQLVSYGAPGEETPVIKGSTVTLNFGDDGHVSGSGGCNGYGGRYAVKDDTIIFSEVISTLMACAETMDQEQLYFAALQSAGRFELSKTGLTIWYDSGTKRLNFVAGKVRSVI